MNCYYRSASHEYFKQNNNFDNQNEGAAYMIGLATSVTTDGCKLMYDDDAILIFFLSKFVSNLTRNQRIELGFILQLITKKIKR